MENQEVDLSRVFISPSGRLCKTLFLLGKERYTMLDVSPKCYFNINALTKKEIEELTFNDITLMS